MADKTPALPRTIFVLGVVSFLMDLSSEMIHALLPVFLVSVLGAGPLVLGVIEGVAEAFALMIRVVSGVLSDRTSRRKPWVLSGYFLSAAAKPAFALAGSVGAVFAARLVDRLGKGIRRAPRDALIGDLAAAGQRGSAFGLRQSLDTAGAVGGPLLAIGLLATIASTERQVFWFASIPALLCVLLLWVGVRETPRRVVPGDRVLANPGAAFWRVALVGGVLQLARFSEAFLVLRADELGWSLATIPVVFLVMNLSYALTAYPAGRLSDRLGRKRLLVPGILLLILADAVMALLPGTAALLAGIVLWGAHLGLTAGILAAMVTDAAPAHLRGSAFGIFNLLSGVALLLASVVAGLLWQWSGHGAAFLAGAGVAAVAALLALRRD